MSMSRALVFQQLVNFLCYLVTSNFSFFHSVFKKLQTRKNQGLFGKGLRELQKNLWEKKEMLVTSNFSFFYCFLRYQGHKLLFELRSICCLQMLFNLDQSKILLFGKEFRKIKQIVGNFSYLILAIGGIKKWICSLFLLLLSGFKFNIFFNKQKFASDHFFH